jgi:cation diffusion facilitator family transporter
MNPSMGSRPESAAASRAMAWSVAVGVIMLALKVGGYYVTHSAAILSDAAESVVHVVAVAFAAYSLRLSFKPADESHRYGHAKISFFSAGLEGGMILIAAGYIYVESIHKLLHGAPTHNLGLGALLIAAAALINGVLGWYLVHVGKKTHSLILEANGKHTLTDCWTSVAVLVSLALVYLTNYHPIDPIIGILMATNILVTGLKLVRSGFSGLMDASDPKTQARILAVLDRETARHSITYHNLRHRNMGDSYWIDVHLVFPPGVLLSDAHRTATAIESSLETTIQPSAHVTTHLESALDHDVLHRGGD